jgi:hypothetical protein
MRPDIDEFSALQHLIAVDDELLCRRVDALFDVAGAGEDIPLLVGYAA